MTPDRPNVVLVSIDSLRADHCGYLGDDRGLTPTLDALAGDGVAFERAIAPGPQTYSSMPAVFSGYHRRDESLAGYPGTDHWERRLAAIDGHLARYGSFVEDLSRMGYATAGVSPNPWTSTASGFDRGFDAFADFARDGGEGWVARLVEHLPGLDADSRATELAANMLAGRSFFARWESVYDEVRAARETLSEPYFLWVFLLDTHFPFVASRAHREEQSLPALYYTMVRSAAPMRGNADSMPESVRGAVKRSYRDAVRASDAFLARLRSDLAADDPALLVHSDHGESFGDHGEYGHNRAQVYEENVHVPFVVHNAGASQDVAAPTSLATVPDVVRSLAREGTFDPGACSRPCVVAASEDGANRAVRGSRYKYVETADGSRLFDLERDPDEATDLGDDRPDRRRELREHLEAFEATRAERARLGAAAAAVAERADL